MTDYNGWKNRDTWNVALWLGEGALYQGTVEFMKDYEGQQAYVDFVESCGLDSQNTPDGVYYLSEELDYPRLDDMMWEHAELIQCDDCDAPCQTRREMTMKQIMNQELDEVIENIEKANSALVRAINIQRAGR
jgi:hypothetical protein